MEWSISVTSPCPHLQIKLAKKKRCRLDVVAQGCDASNRKAEAGLTAWAQSQLGLHTIKLLRPSLKEAIFVFSHGSTLTQNQKTLIQGNCYSFRGAYTPHLFLISIREFMQVEGLLRRTWKQYLDWNWVSILTRSFQGRLVIQAIWNTEARGS